MRTLPGYTSVFRVYQNVLFAESKGFLARCVFGPLIRQWEEVCKARPTAYMVILRAFLDRYWDTTTTFHLPGYEAGITLTDFGVMSGLPCGGLEMEWDFAPPSMGDSVVLDLIGDGLKIQASQKKSMILIKTSCIIYYFNGEGIHGPKEGSHEQYARLWLWWFLGSTYFGDKRERVGTSLLRYLSDWDKMGEYDWVTPALGLTIRYMRDAVRPNTLEKGSAPSLVFSGIIIEAWMFSHFPSLLPAGFVPPMTYPAFHGWGTCNRARITRSYDRARCLLNDMTIEKFVPKPWERYTGIPGMMLARLSSRDVMRLYLHYSLGSFWYLGERLGLQTHWAEPIVSEDPHACLFT